MVAFNKEHFRKNAIAKHVISSHPDVEFTVKPLKAGILLKGIKFFQGNDDIEVGGAIPAEVIPDLFDLMVEVIATTVCNDDGELLFRDENDVQSVLRYREVAELGMKIFNDNLGNDETGLEEKKDSARKAKQGK